LVLTLGSTIEYQQIKDDLEMKLVQLLHKTNDKFLPGREYIKKWGYVIDEKIGSIPYARINYQSSPLNK